MNPMIIVENVDAKVPEMELQELISGLGAVESVQLAKEETPGSGTRIAFVTVRSAKHGKAIISALDGKTYWGHVLKVKAMKTRSGETGPGSIGIRSGQKLNKGDGRASSHAW